MSGYNADPIGSGHIVEQDGNKYYVGKLPFKHKDKVYIIKQESLEALVKEGFKLLVSNRIPMVSEFFEQFPDEIKFKAQEEITHLLLDRHFYSPDLTDVVYVRYASMNRFDKEKDMVHDRTDIKPYDENEDPFVDHDKKDQATKSSKAREMDINGRIEVPDDDKAVSPDGKWYYDGNDWYEVDEDE